MASFDRVNEFLLENYIYTKFVHNTKYEQNIQCFIKYIAAIHICSA